MAFGIWRGPWRRQFHGLDEGEDGQWELVGVEGLAGMAVVGAQRGHVDLHGRSHQGAAAQIERSGYLRGAAHRRGFVDSAHQHLHDAVPGEADCTLAGHAIGTFGGHHGP